jgi:hypothetical protein
MIHSPPTPRTTARLRAFAVLGGEWHSVGCALGGAPLSALLRRRLVEVRGDGARREVRMTEAGRLMAEERR